MRVRFWIFIPVLLAVVLGLFLAPRPDLATGEEPFAALGPLGPVPTPPDNPTTPAKVELGKLLFFDNRLSGDGSTPCLSCHFPHVGWGDGADICRGYPGTKHWRNCQTIVNSAYYNKLFWAGSSKSLEAQAETAARGAVAGNGERDMMEARLLQIPEYVKRFKEVFGTRSPHLKDAWRAIAAFERTIVQRNTPFDRYMKGDKGAMSARAVRGLAMFSGKAGCIQCHNGAYFSDGKPYNLGVPTNPEIAKNPLRQVGMRSFFLGMGVPRFEHLTEDVGYYTVSKVEADKGKFVTPTLRELSRTAPYMHNGMLKTLDEVIEFYNQGGGKSPNKTPLLKPLRLTASEKAALVEFLKSLSGDEVVVTVPELPKYEVIKNWLKVKN